MEEYFVSLRCIQVIRWHPRRTMGFIGLADLVVSLCSIGVIWNLIQEKRSLTVGNNDVNNSSSNKTLDGDYDVDDILAKHGHTLFLPPLIGIIVVGTVLLCSAIFNNYCLILVAAVKTAFLIGGLIPYNIFLLAVGIHWIGTIPFILTAGIHGIALYVIMDYCDEDGVSRKKLTKPPEKERVFDFEPTETSDSIQTPMSPVPSIVAEKFAF